MQANVVSMFFAAFTTAVAFISLIFGEIKPVIEFGKMMAVGMVFAFVLTFTFFANGDEDFNQQ